MPRSMAVHSLLALSGLLLAGCETQPKHATAALEWNRTRADATLAIAEEQTASGQFDQARQTLAGAKTTTDVRIEVARARLDLEQGNYAAVLARLTPLADSAATNPHYHRLCAVALEASGRPSEAAIAYARAYELDAAPDLLVGWVDTLQADGRTGEARDILERERGRFPGHAALAVLAADLAREHGDHETAIRELTAAIRAEPNSSEIQRRQAKAFMAAGQAMQAAETWRELSARSTDATQRQCYNRYLADALACAGRPQEARELYASLAVQQPSNTAVRLSLALTSVLAGRTDEALEAALQVLASEPDNAAAHLVAAVCYRRLAQPAAAAGQLAEVRTSGELATLAEQLRSRVEQVRSN